MSILGMFQEFRDAVGGISEERSSSLVVQAAQAKASVAPTVAGYKALAEIAEADADVHEAAGESFKVQLVSQVRKMEVDVGVAQATVAVQQRFAISQEQLAGVMKEHQQLATKYSQTLAGGGQRMIGASTQKQLPW
jgi:hypothetical protein